MQELIDKYDTSDIPYLPPIIRNNGMDEWHQYQNEAHRINRNLKHIGKQMGWVFHLLLMLPAMHGPVLLKVKMSLYLLSVKHWDMIRSKPPEFILPL